MSLDNKDLEQIEHVIYKNGDDIAVSIARSFERMEERIDAMESRLNNRLSVVEDKIDASEENLSKDLNSIRDVMNQ